MAREAARARLLRMALAAEIQAHRERADLSPTQTYRIANIAKNTYLRLEGGTRDALLDDAIRIAEAVGADPGDFVNAVVARARTMDAPPRSVEEYRGAFGFDPESP